MADTLSIRVSLELNAIEASRDLSNQINTMEIDPIKVGLKLDPNKIDLSALNKIDFSEIRNRFRDIFDIDGEVIRDLKESVNSIERILNTKLSVKNLALFDQFAESLTDLGRAFNIDSKSLSQFEKLNSTLTEFNKLSKEAQDALVSKKPSRKFTGNLDDFSNEVDKKFGVSSQNLAQSVKKGTEDLDKSLEDIGNSQIKSVTKYLDVQDGISEVVKKKWNDWTDLTTTTFTDGTQLGKLTSNVEGYLNKIENQYKSVSDNIRKYSIDLHKAISEGELGDIAHYESIIKDFENLKKKMITDVGNSPFADKLASEFSKIDSLNSKVKDLATSQYDRGVSEKEQKKYLKSVEEYANKIYKLNKEISQAESKGLGEYTKSLVADMKTAKGELSKLLNIDVKDIFPDDIKARTELKRKATDIIEAMDDANNLYNSKVAEMKNKKLEESGLNKFVAEYKKNVNEIEALEKKISTALDIGQIDYASELQAEVNALNEKQTALKENAKTLASYEKAMKSVAEVEGKSQKNIELHNAYLENKNKLQQQQADKKAEEKQVKEEEAKRQAELKEIQNRQKQYWEDMLKHQDVISKGYEQVTQTLTSKQNQYIEAIANDSTDKAEGLRKSIEYWKEQKDKLLREINNGKFTSDFYDDIKGIDKRNDLAVGEFEGALADKISSQNEKERLRQENKALKELVSDYKKNASEISSLKKELLSTEEGSQTSDVAQSRIKALEKEQREIKKSIKEYDDYTDALERIKKIQKQINANDKLAGAKNADKVAKETGKTEEDIVNKIAKEREKLEKLVAKEQTSVIDTYEKYAKLVNQAEKQYLTAVINDDTNTAEALEKVVDRYQKLKTDILTQINDKGLDSLFKGRLDDINNSVSLDFNVHAGKVEDNQVKKQLKEDSQALKEYVNEYDRLYKNIVDEQIKVASYTQKGETVNAQAHKNNLTRLKEELSAHEKTVEALKYNQKAQEEVSKIKNYHDNSFELGMAGVSQKIQTSTFKEFKKEQDSLVTRYKELYSEQEKFEKAMSTTVDTSAYKKLESELDGVKNKLKEVRSQITSQDHKDKIELFDADKTTAQGREVVQTIGKVKTEAEKMLSTVKELKNSEYVDKSSLSMIETSLKALSNASLDGTKEDVRQLNAELSETKNLLSQVQKGVSDNIFQSNKSIKLSEINDSIRKFKADFGDVLDKASFQALEDSAKRLSKIMDKDSFSQGAKELTAQLKNARSQMDGLVQSSEKYNFFEDLYTNMRTYQLGDLIVDGIQDALYSVKDIVISLDSAMANVRKVADPIDINSIDKLENIKSKAISISKEVGMASEDVINSIADTVQSGGYRIEEAIEIARQTMMLANVGEMSAENATKGVVSMLAGFDLRPLREMQVEVGGITQKTNELTNAMDMVNHVGNNFAISTEGIINAMQSGGTVLHSYGVTMEETVGLITGANKTLQDPNVVGNGLEFWRSM
ncbi:MAG: phage tail tape measure protein [Peptostreptococcaceae bacterium]|nr:phage tail tape measure protein [Peptostreptococcaceae bacterium]